MMWSQFFSLYLGFYFFQPKMGDKPSKFPLALARNTLCCFFFVFIGLCDNVQATERCVDVLNEQSQAVFLHVPSQRGWQLKWQINQAAWKLNKDFENLDSQRLFKEQASELLLRDYRNIPYIFRSFSFVFRKQKPDLKTLNFMVEVLSFHSVPRDPHGSVMTGFSKVITQGIQRGQLSDVEAVALVDYLKAQGINFLKIPKPSLRPWLVGGGSWVYGDILRALKKQKQPTRYIEGKIFEEFSGLSRTSSLVTYRASVEKSRWHYGFSQQLIDRLDSYFMEWLHTLPGTAGSRILLDMKFGQMTVEQMFGLAARVVPLKQYLLEAKSGRDQGYLLGQSGLLYDSIAEISGLLHFRRAYRKHWMSLTMDSNLGQARIHTNNFMRKVQVSGDPVVFLISSSINKATYTRFEIEYLSKQPEFLERVTFVTID